MTRCVVRRLGASRPLQRVALAMALAMSALSSHEAQAQRIPRDSLRDSVVVAFVKPSQGAAAQSAGASASQATNLRLRVAPDSVHVGDPFSLVASVDVPLDATVQWPTIADTGEVVVMRAATRVTSEVVGVLRRETAQYSLVAWDVGLQPVGLADVTVRAGSSVISVPLRDARIDVKTVLPGDTSLHVPKPARDPFPRVVPWWEAWWPSAVVALALAALWWLWRRRRARVVKPTAPPPDLYTRTCEAFDRLDRLGLTAVGERGRAVSLSLEIVRGYLAERIPAAALSRTSAEVLQAIRDDTRVPHEQLAALIAEIDGIKYAQQTLSPTHAATLQANARAVVELIERADVAKRKATQALQAADARAVQEAQSEAEDEARRQSRRRKAGVP
jgi:hypothetical protein